MAQTAAESPGMRDRPPSSRWIEANPSEAPLAAWTLGVHLLWTENIDGNVVIRSPSDQSSAAGPDSGARRLVARAAPVAVYARCRA